MWAWLWVGQWVWPVEKWSDITSKTHIICLSRDIIWNVFLMFIQSLMHLSYCICKVLSNSSAIPFIYTNLKQGCIHSCRERLSFIIILWRNFTLELQGFVVILTPKQWMSVSSWSFSIWTVGWWEPWKLQCSQSSKSISYMDMVSSRELFKKRLPSSILDSRPSNTAQSQLGRKSKSRLEKKQFWLILHCKR